MPMIGKAVGKTAAAKGLSPSRAKMELLRACEQGLITAWWPHHLGPQRVPRYEFSGADVEVESDTLLLPKGEQRRKGNVSLDDAEFEAWLAPAQPADGQAETQAAEPELVQDAQTETSPADDQAAAATQAGGHKAALIRKAADEIGRSALKDLPPQAVFDRVAKRVQEKHGVIVSKTHTLETLELKKRRAI